METEKRIPVAKNSSQWPPAGKGEETADNSDYAEYRTHCADNYTTDGLRWRFGTAVYLNGTLTTFRQLL